MLCYPGKGDCTIPGISVQGSTRDFPACEAQQRQLDTALSLSRQGAYGDGSFYFLFNPPTNTFPVPKTALLPGMAGVRLTAEVPRHVFSLLSKARWFFCEV